MKLLRWIGRLLEEIFSNDCPYCHVELEACWSGSWICPRCGYDSMTGKRLITPDDEI